MVSSTRALPMYVVHEVEGRSRAAAPKGSMTYAFTHMGNFLLLLLAIEIWVFRRRFRPEGWDLGLVADFEPRGLD